MSMATVLAQPSSGETSIIQEKDTVWGFGVDGINLYERKMHRIDISYQTKDPEGKPCRMSGVIIIPKDVYDGEQICDGVVLYNHYAQMAKKNVPSRGHNQGEDMVLANPLSPNYIMVLPDFYGFGITEDKEQWFCFGDANGHASIDCLLAAQALLKERGISQGKFLINAGYSSGGYDALAAQKVRDMEYQSQISFDRTVVGGLPFDISEAYSQYVSSKDESWRFFAILMIINSYNQHANLGFTPEQLLKPPYAEKFLEWMNSGKYTTDDIKKEMYGKKLSDVIQEPFLTTSSDEYKKVRQALDAHALKNGWVPDPSQKYSVFHLFKDTTVPCSSGRKLLSFLSEYKYEDGRQNPFKKSIIPEQTHLTTNFVIPMKDHSPAGGIAYYIGLTAILAALPVLYYDDELNTHYADLIKGLTPLEIVKTLDEKYDLRALINGNTDTNRGSTDFISVLANIIKTVDVYMEPYDLSFTDLLTMADDSGLSMTDIYDIYTYLTTDKASANKSGFSNEAAPAVGSEALKMPFLTDYYINYLNNWYYQSK